MTFWQFPLMFDQYYVQHFWPDIFKINRNAERVRKNMTAKKNPFKDYLDVWLKCKYTHLILSIVKLDEVWSLRISQTFHSVFFFWKMQTIQAWRSNMLAVATREYHSYSWIWIYFKNNCWNIEYSQGPSVHYLLYFCSVFALGLH